MRSSPLVKEANFVLPDIFYRKVYPKVRKLTLGYWENEAKTKEVMIRDDEGTLWMMTGDEGSMDKDGYLSITGRIKDIIIRGNSVKYKG
jgi:acyl-CoA synthetase (AMP-forming)/AMP-acid ligase II